ncbi:hypothetical protein V2J09_006678 [Rumex salicifolius]
MLREGLVHLFVVYAAPSPLRRRSLWGEHENIISGLSKPVFIGGDLNTIICSDERMGGNGRLSPDSLEFGDRINKLCLVDLGFKGQRRLPSLMPPFLFSDHAPLHLQLTPTRRCNAARRPFRLEAAWLSHEDFKALLSASWNPNLSTPEALNQLREVRKLIELSPSDALLNKKTELEKEVELILEQEEILWYRKSREKWVPLGDRNTTFFHTSTIIRRRRNRIDSLRGDMGGGRRMNRNWRRWLSAI